MQLRARQPSHQSRSRHSRQLPPRSTPRRVIASTPSVSTSCHRIAHRRSLFSLRVTSTHAQVPHSRSINTTPSHSLLPPSPCAKRRPRPFTPSPPPSSSQHFPFVQTHRSYASSSPQLQPHFDPMTNSIQLSPSTTPTSSSHSQDTTSSPPIDFTTVRLDELVPAYLEHSPARIARLNFLGTSSAVPSPGRANVSSMLWSLSNGKSIMVDCGEATQHQLMLSESLRMGRIETILITHLHGDHFFGIFGLLASLGTFARTSPLTVVGPTGLKAAIDAVFNSEWNQVNATPQLATAAATSASVASTIVSPASVTASPSQMQQPLTDDGSYNLKVIEVPTHIPTVLAHPDIQGQDPNDPFCLAGDTGVDIVCVPIAHRVPTVGYVLVERSKTGKLDPVKARALGAQNQHMAALKGGKNVTLENGTVVKSLDVVGDPIRGRSFCVLQDTYNPSQFQNLLHNVDIMVHECTYGDDLYTKAVEHGHSTPSMAATFAWKMKAKNLILTHFSSRYVKEHACLHPDGTTVYSNPKPNPFVQRDDVLSPEQCLQLEQVAANDATSAIVTPATYTKSLQSKYEQRQQVTSVDVHNDDDDDDDGCCGTNHPAIGDAKHAAHDMNLAGQILEPYRFTTNIYTIDAFATPNTQDLRTQAEFCLSQLATAQEGPQQEKPNVFIAADYRAFTYQHNSLIQIPTPDFNLASFAGLHLVNNVPATQ